jgi:hypothetical protein
MNGELDSAINMMNVSGPDAFPVFWDPHPKFPERSRSGPELTEVIRLLKDVDAPVWVNDRLMVNADEILLRQRGWTQGGEASTLVNGLHVYLTIDQIENVIQDFRRLQALELSDHDLLVHAKVIEELACRSLELAQAKADEDPR